MNGIKEQLVEDLIEEAFSKEIYVVTPLCYRDYIPWNDGEAVEEVITSTYSRAFFTKEAAEKYLKEFNVEAGAEFQDEMVIPHVITKCRINDTTFKEGVMETIVGRNNNMVRENQIWKTPAPIDYFDLRKDCDSLRKDYDDLDEKYLKFLTFNRNLMWSFSGLLALINFRNAHTNGKLKYMIGAYAILLPLAIYGPRTKYGNGFIEWMLNKFGK